MKYSMIILCLSFLSTVLAQRPPGGGGGGRGGGGGGNPPGGGGGGGNPPGGGGGGGGGGVQGGGNPGGGGGGGGGGGPPPVDNTGGDVTPPIIVGRTIENSDIIEDAAYEMSAEVTDDTGILFVRFTVNPPGGGNMVEYQATNKPNTNMFVAPVFFYMSGAYTSTVIARDTVGNIVESASISFTVQGVNDEEPTVEDRLAIAKVRIQQTIATNRRIAATYVRMGFHDCVPNGVAGGCDGCLNLNNNPANNGLLPAVQALAPIVLELENDDLSRADIWAYAALVASEVSQNTLDFTDLFKVGRENCETRGTCTSNGDCATDGPDQLTDFPHFDLTTHQLITFMNDHFGFDEDDTVAIMGAHTLGRALPQNSGFEGQNGWVNDNFDLDNEYYRQLVGGGNGNDVNTDLEVLAAGPNWNQVEVNTANNGIVYQWVRGGNGGGGGGPPPPPARMRRSLQQGGGVGGGGGGGGGRGPIIMLNADMALVRDLEKDLVNGEAMCSFRFPQADRCPLAATLTKAGIYRSNNDEWLSDFKDAMYIMLEKGMPSA